MSVAEIVEDKRGNMEVVVDMEYEVCVSRVPISLKSEHPEAFNPQFVGLGPYHHSRSELTMTDYLKSEAAKRIMNQDIKIKVSDVQPFYHKDTLHSYSQKDDDKLLKDITIDASFLLALLNRSLHSQPRDNTHFLTGKHGMPLVNAFGVVLTIDAIIRDVFMLENQIPTHVLRQLNTQHGIPSHDFDEKMLSFCKNYCPLVKFQQLSKSPQKHDHLLDLMYHLVAPMPNPKPDTVTTERSPESSGTDAESSGKPTGNTDNAESSDKPAGNMDNNAESSGKSTDDTENAEYSGKPTGSSDNTESPDKSGGETDAKGCCSIFCSICFYIFMFFVVIGAILWYLLFFIWQIVRFVFRFLYGILKNVSLAFVKVVSCFLPMTDDIPQLKESQGPVSKFFDSCKQTGDIIRQRLFEEKDKRPAVTIQSVTELDGAGIRFQPTNSIKDIKFVAKDKELFLPVIKLNENTEVIMRNLVAYESLTRPTYLIFTRYVEIMRAIIDTPQDVKLLVKNEIIVTKLSDKVVTDLFNGMSTSIRPTETPELEEVIKKVKMKFEESQWLQKTVTDYVTSSWKILTVIAAFFFFVLTTVQTFCSVYDCASHFSSNLGNLPPVSDNGLISSI